MEVGDSRAARLNNPFVRNDTQSSLSFPSSSAPIGSAGWCEGPMLDEREDKIKTNRLER